MHGVPAAGHEAQPWAQVGEARSLPRQIDAQHGGVGSVPRSNAAGGVVVHRRIGSSGVKRGAHEAAQPDAQHSKSSVQSSSSVGLRRANKKFGLDTRPRSKAGGMADSLRGVASAMESMG